MTRNHKINRVTRLDERQRHKECRGELICLGLGHSEGLDLLPWCSACQGNIRMQDEVAKLMSGGESRSSLTIEPVIVDVFPQDYERTVGVGISLGRPHLGGRIDLKMHA